MKNYVPAFNYDFLTPFYDFCVELLGYGKAQRIKIINLLNLKTDEKLLDIGCGTGTLLILAKRKYPEIEMSGIDIDPTVLKIAKSKSKKEKVGIQFIETTSAKLPFDDSSFNVVVSSLVFHHLPTEIKKQTLKEIYRVLKKNGRFLFADFGNKEGLAIPILDFLSKSLRLPESKTLQDNIAGKIPIWLNETGFRVRKIADRYRGVEFLLAEKI